jgi:hypothetical protein
MNLKTKRILLLVAPLAVGGVLLYAMNHKKKVASGGAKDGAQDDAKPVPAPPPASMFPLKNGSNNAKVKELQSAIGLSGKDVDGIFGSGTEAKLKAFAGVIEVADQAALDQIKKKAVGITNNARASDLLSKFQKGGVAIYTTAKLTVQKVQEDISGALISTGTFVSMAANKTYNNQDYKLKGTTKLGNLLMEITRGDMAGTYSLDPNSITLVAAPAPGGSSVPVMYGLGVMF